jgi:Transposase DDE domain
MTADLEALVVAAYVFADEYTVPARPGRPAKISDAELVALAVAQAAMGLSSDRQFLGLVAFRLRGWFPHLPDQSQYNRRLRALVEVISATQQRLARWLDAGGVRLADGTLIGVANYPGCAERSHFAGLARYGRSPAKSQWVWGVRLILLSDRRGVPLGYTIVPANELEREGLRDLLATGAGDMVIGDRGVEGRAYAGSLAAAGIQLLTPARERSLANAGHDRALIRFRLTIESAFANLKRQMRLEQHLAKTPAGLAVRIAQRLLALTLGILLNTLQGRPARSLVAYDGR